jgi:hypothetical protein
MRKIIIAGIAAAAFALPAVASAAPARVSIVGGQEAPAGASLAGKQAARPGQLHIPVGLSVVWGTLR